MAGRTGTHDISFLLASTNPITNGSLTFDEVVTALDSYVAAYNTIMRDQLDSLCSVRTGVAGRIGVYGGSAAGSMTEVDEYGRAPTQRAAAVAQVGFPFKKYQYNVGWTKEWQKRKSAADFARSVQGAQAGHRLRVSAEVKKALFLSANFDFGDHLIDNATVAVKRLVNADGATIPNGPNGETFNGSTHTHYLGSATLTTTAVDGAITHLIEHGHGARVRIYINQTNETAFRALTGFVAYVDPRLMLGTQANQPAQRLDISTTDNRAIGIYGAAEIWTKPWIPANYLLVFDAGSPNKTLGLREDPQGSLDLTRAAQFEDHPLLVDFYESYFGFGVLTRTNGVVLYFANATYADPTITNP